MGAQLVGVTGKSLGLQVGALEDAGRLEEAEALARAAVREQLGDALRRITEETAPPGGHALIIDGKALLHALGDDTKDSLLAVRCFYLEHFPLRSRTTCAKQLRSAQFREQNFGLNRAT